MKDWTRHEKGDEPIPDLIYGHASASETPAEPDANFSLDKSGLYLPEGAARERRKVKIGFQPPENA